MNRPRLINALGVSLAALITAAGLLLPARLLKEKEKDYLAGEWSEVSIGGTGFSTADPDYPETPAEKRLSYLLDFAGSQKSDDFRILGREFFRKAKIYADDQLSRMIDVGVLPPALGWFVMGESEVASVSASGAFKTGFLSDGLTRPASEAEDIGVVSIRLWIAGYDLRGSVDILADSSTGRIIDLLISISGAYFDPEIDGYGILWAFASYLGLSARERFTGSIVGDFVTMNFGNVSLSLESTFRERSVRFHISAHSSGESGVAAETEKIPSAEPTK